MTLRKKTKPHKVLKFCSCGCERIINGKNVIRADCAIDFVKKMGYEIYYFIGDEKSPNQVIKEMRLKNA